MSREEYSGVLIITESYDGRIHRVAYELLNKGREITAATGEKLECLVLTDKEGDFGELSLRGADKVWFMKSDRFKYPEEVIFAENITSFIKEHRPAAVLIGATHFGRSLAPRVAAALSTGLTADCTNLLVDEEGNLEQVRPAFSDNILAHIKTNARPQMATVRYKEFEEASRDESRTVDVQVIEPYSAQSSGISIEKMLSLGEKDITDAEVVVAGGRGIKKEEDLLILQQLADALGGQVGVSRALVDAGMAPSAMQVGYSGNRVKPKVYIACGISGAPQHLAGMKESDLIIAINNDPAAPIFNVADYGFVGDLYEVVPKLINIFQGEAK